MKGRVQLQKRLSKSFSGWRRQFQVRICTRRYSHWLINVHSLKKTFKQLQKLLSRRAYKFPSHLNASRRCSRLDNWGSKSGWSCPLALHTCRTQHVNVFVSMKHSNIEPLPVGFGFHPECVYLFSSLHSLWNCFPTTSRLPWDHVWGGNCHFPDWV